MHRNKLACSVLALAIAGSMWACGSDDDSGTAGGGSGGASAGSGGHAAGSAGAHAGSAGTTHAGGSGGSGETNAGAGGEAGFPLSSPAEGGDSPGSGNAGSAGDSSKGGAAGAASAPTLAENCATICAAQTGLTCTFGDPCVAGCIGTADPDTGTSDVPKYEAMIACEAQHLTASDYECHDQGPSIWPGPKANTACKDAICAWTLADQYGAADVVVAGDCP